MYCVIFFSEPNVPFFSVFLSDIIRRNRDRFVGGVVSGITLFLCQRKRVQVVNKHSVINIGPRLHKAKIFNDEAKPQVALYNIKAKLSLFFFYFSTMGDFYCGWQ